MTGPLKVILQTSIAGKETIIPQKENTPVVNNKRREQAGAELGQALTGTGIYLD